MVVTFPHCGSGWVPLKTLFDKHGIKCIVPPKSSKRTMSLGVRHSPEWVCFPYKILLGNMIEGLDMGADTVLNVGGAGLCRLGYYAKLQEETLHDLGYKFDMVIFDWQEAGIVAMARFIRKLLGNSWAEVISDIRFGLLGQLKLMDEVEHRVQWIRPREVDKGAASRIWRGAGDRVAAVRTREQLNDLRAQIMAELDAIPLDPGADPPRVALLGEFFMAIDSFCNMDIEEELGKRGVEVVRHAWLTDWAKAWLLLEMLGLGHGRKVKAAARPYLSRDVSGDGVNYLGETVLLGHEGFAGVVHVMPFTCMPEVIAQNILPRVIEQHHMPVLNVVLDEQMGKAGLVTRVEAFVDLIQRRHCRAAC